MSHEPVTVAEVIESEQRETEEHGKHRYVSCVAWEDETAKRQGRGQPLAFDGRPDIRAQLANDFRIYHPATGQRVVERDGLRGRQCKLTTGEWVYALDAEDFAGSEFAREQFFVDWDEVARGVVARYIERQQSSRYKHRDHRGTSISVLVQSMEEDAHQSFDNMEFSESSTNTKIWAHEDEDSCFSAGHMWPVSIPQGASISSAVWAVTASAATRDSVRADIHAEEVDDAETFMDNPDLLSRSFTSGSVNWTEDDIALTDHAGEVTVTTLLQTIISRSGWNSGNNFHLVARGQNSSPTKKLNARAYDFNPAKAGRIEADYSLTSMAVVYHHRQRI